jgi:hypothetical protein
MWATENGPNEILRLKKVVYLLLKEAFPDFVPARHIFLRHQAGQPLCASRVWFSLLDTFKSQLHGRESHSKQSVIGHSVALQQRVRRGNKRFLSTIFELLVNLNEWWAVSNPRVFVDWNFHHLVSDLQH